MTSELTVDELLERLTTDKSSIVEILKLLKAGSKPAFEALFIVYSPRFYWYLRRRWRFSHEDADELVNDVFMLVLTSIHRFDPQRGAAPGWLWTICHNAAANKRVQIAREASRRAPLPSIDNEDAIFATLTLEEQLEIEKFENAISHCLASSFA